MVIGGMIFLLSMSLAVPLKKGVQPEGNPNYYYINIEGPPGATLADMRQTVDSRRRSLGASAGDGGDCSRRLARGGISGGPGGFVNTSGVSNGAVVAVLKPDRRASVAQIRDRLRPLLRQIPDARLSFDISGFGAGGVQIILTSETGVGLENAALELQRQMRTVEGLADPRPATPPSGPELVVKPRADEAARLGVPVTTIAEAARIATLGDIDANVSKMDEGERRIPIRVRLPENDRAQLSVIRNLRLPTANGGVTTLDSVADVYFQAGPGQINRVDRKRNITMQADTTGDTQVGDAIARVHKLPILQHLPPGVGLANQGQEKAYGQLFGGFAIAILAAIGLVYAVMVLLFGSFFKPMIILSALPTAIGGALLALLVSDLSLSIPSLIGFLMLMGLAAKNSILLVEYAIERERDGATPARRADGGLPRAGAADRHDHHGHGRRHAAHRPGPRQGLGVPPADGGGGDRRPDHLHGAVAGAGAGGL